MHQAMVHERLGIQNQRVDLSNVPGVKKDMKVGVDWMGWGGVRRAGGRQKMC
jgi:hypothetical protein